MSDFNIRSDSVNVEQIMRQVRARIAEKRGVDYTEEQIRELAAVKLERFLDPQKVRSELLQQFRGAPLPNYAFEDTTLFESSRPPIRWIRRLLLPILKLFFNPNPLIQALHIQADLNNRHAQYSELSYEVQHNLVLEITRLGIEVKNLKMRVESLSSRLDFSERRARALEGVVQYRAGDGPEVERPASAGPVPAGTDDQPARDGDQATAEQRRRRRRRRGRRGGAGRGPGAEEMGAAEASENGSDAGPDAHSGGPSSLFDQAEPADTPARPDANADRDDQ